MAGRGRGAPFESVVGSLTAIAVWFFVPPRAGGSTLSVAALLLAGLSVSYPGACLAQSGGTLTVLGEAAVGVVVLAAAHLGSTAATRWLAIGFAIHGVWSLAHHTGAISTRVARWFPPFAAAFALTTAVLLTFAR